MFKEFKITTTLPATAEAIYNAWLDGNLHTKMTGGEASGKPEAGTKFTAWDGYISGENISLTPNNNIIQAWRTSEFPAEAADSKVEIQLENIDEGCRITLIHSNIPEGEADYEKGWEEHYFTPMRSYFGK